MDFGALKRLTILCISKTGWHDTANAARSHQRRRRQRCESVRYPLGNLHSQNAAGSSTLVEAEATDGTLHRFLFDIGWGLGWMDRRLAEEDVDKMLERREIEFLAISHEHFATAVSSGLAAITAKKPPRQAFTAAAAGLIC